MIGASKILTVSYGTFSCTLEGFDDPFNTMRAIAEYFRDLAADDRYFGAEPPTPDAAMLHRIAEREVSRRVEARIQDNGVILRTGDAMTPGYAETATPPQAPALPQPVARVVAAPVDAVVPDADRPADDLSDTPTIASGAQPRTDLATSAEDDAEPEQAAADAVVADEASVLASGDAMPAIPDPSAPDSGSMPDTPAVREVPAIPRTATVPADAALPGPGRMPGGVAARLQRARAALTHEPEARRDPAAILASQPTDVAARQPDGLIETAGPASQSDERSDDLPEPDTRPLAQDEYLASDPIPDTAAEPVPADDAVEEAGDQEHDPTSLAIDLPDVAPSDIALVVETDDEPAFPFHADASGTVENEEAFLAGLTVLIAAPAQPALTEAQFTEVDDSDDLNGFLVALDHDDDAPRAVAEAAITPEDVSPYGDTVGYDDWSSVEAYDATADTVDGDDTPDAGIVPTAESDLDLSRTTFPDTGDETLADAAPGPVAYQVANDGADPRSGTPDEAPEVRPFEVGPLSEKAQRARARVIRVRRGDAPDLPEPVVQQTPPALSPEEEAELAAELAALRTGDARTVAEISAPSQTDESARSETDLRRELETATGDESVTRLIAQTNTELQGPESRRRLSAIAHLKAAVAATVADRRAGAAPAPTEAARIDPYRHDLERVVRPRRPGTEIGDAARPAPLVLVSAQRIDRPGAPQPVAHPVRPRRVMSAALAPSVAELDEEDAAFLAEEANIFADAKGFAEFADRLGATELSDLLEAAAAYCACVEGRPHFSRPHLMSHVAAVAEGGLSREDGLRGFGRLMRMGRIVKLKRGQFALTEDSRLLAEARKIAG